MLVCDLSTDFLKLASAWGMFLMRLFQAGSLDLILVFKHYSLELVAYVWKVLHII